MHPQSSCQRHTTSTCSSCNCVCNAVSECTSFLEKPYPALAWLKLRSYLRQLYSRSYSNVLCTHMIDCNDYRVTQPHNQRPQYITSVLTHHVQLYMCHWGCFRAPGLKALAHVVTKLKYSSISVTLNAVYNSTFHCPANVMEILWSRLMEHFKTQTWSPPCIFAGIPCLNQYTRK